LFLVCERFTVWTKSGIKISAVEDVDVNEKQFHLLSNIHNNDITGVNDEWSPIKSLMINCSEWNNEQSFNIFPLCDLSNLKHPDAIICNQVNKLCKYF
jgi:hypothetical protein